MNVHYPVSKPSTKEYLLTKKLGNNLKPPFALSKSPTTFRHPFTPQKLTRPHGTSRQRSDAAYLQTELESGFEANFFTGVEPMECEGFQPDIMAWSPNQIQDTLKEGPNSPCRLDTSRKPKNFSFTPNSKQLLTFQQEVSKPLRQSVLKIDSSNGIRFKLEQTAKKNVLYGFGEDKQTQLCPVWSVPAHNSDLKMNLELRDVFFPRFYTVTVEKLLNWPQSLAGSKAFFELYGILENVSAWKYPLSKVVTLKDEKMRNRVQSVFYEIDRSLHPPKIGEWKRCIVLRRETGYFQCLKIRSAAPAELKNLDAMVTSSSKSKALLLKTAHHQSPAVRDVY